MEGIITPIITPHHDDGSIDVPAFDEMTEYLIDAGVHSLVVGGSTGEVYAQTMDERVELAKHAVDVVAGRVPVIMGVGATRTEEAIELGLAARDAGADAILVNSPPYAVPTDQENALHALRIDRAVGLPIMLYNYPGRMGVSMGEDYFTRVSQSKNVVAIKESSGNLGQLHMLARHFPNIALSCGWDDLALEFFAWGAPSWVCAGSNFLPAEHIALYEACVREGDFAKGRRIMSAMMPLMNNLDEGDFVQKIKYGCELAGLRAGRPRLPLLPLGEAEAARFAGVVADLKQEVAAVLRTAGSVR